MQTEKVREHLFNIRFSDEEQKRLEAVCAHLGVNAANLVRMLLKEKSRDLGLEPPPQLAEAVAIAKQHRSPKKR